MSPPQKWASCWPKGASYRCGSAGVPSLVRQTDRTAGRRQNRGRDRLQFGIQCCRYPPRAKIVSTIAEWLTSLGLSEYIDRFVENGIDVSVLPDLIDQDLKDLGVLLGHRRKMLRAIAEVARPYNATETRTLVSVC
jgi:hypothetical protein